jgi:hypothetical protein
MLKISEFTNFIKQPLIKKATFAFAAMFILSISLIVLKWGKLPPEVPLYYSLPWGEKQLGSPWELSILPTLCASIFITNLLITFFIAKDNKLTIKLLIATALFVVALLTYSLIRIIFLVS